MIRGILLDRDGTINCERADYVRSVDQLVLLPGALEALARLAALDARILVVTNQSCVGRGVITRETLDEIHRHLEDTVRAAGGRIDGFFVCPHRPDEGCDCRKPAPGLLLRAMGEHGLAPDECVMVGDSLSDAGAALAAGVPCLLVRTGLASPRATGQQGDPFGAAFKTRAGVRVVDSLWHASQVIADETHGIQITQAFAPAPAAHPALRGRDAG